jgi:hypothetical protein
VKVERRHRNCVLVNKRLEIADAAIHHPLAAELRMLCCTRIATKLGILKPMSLLLFKDDGPLRGF